MATTPQTTPLAPNDGLPRKVYQNDFRPGRGNALQAAVASVFGLELAGVPNFVELPEGYESAIRSFCLARGRVSAKLKLTGASDPGERYNGQLCVLRGKSPRGDFGHVVVARWKGSDGGSEAASTVEGFEMVHDPHPDETFLDKGEPFGWCMFFDSASDA